MNTNYGKSTSNSNGGSTRNSFDFDLGLGSNRSKSLNDQRNRPTSYSSSFASAQPKPSWQPGKPSWTHQPAPSQTARPGVNSGPTSMVGDIFGKSWAASGPSGSSSSIGLVNKNPNLFGDLVGSVLGQSKGSNSNGPLKNATPTSNKGTAYSMGNLADSLPKSGNPAKSSDNRGVKESFGSYTSDYTSGNSNVGGATKGSNLGAPSLRSMAGGSGSVGGMSSNKDPFGNLVNFGSKPSGGLNSTTKGGDNNKSNAGDDVFGDFQKGGDSSKSSRGDDVFGDFQNATKSSMGTNTFSSSGFGVNNNNFMGSSMNSSSTVDGFGMPAMNFGSKNQTTVQNSGTDPLDNLFTSTTASATGAQQTTEADDWGLDSEFGSGGGGNDVGGSTTELEGLPPPPAGVTAATAKSKGMDNYKQGQYPDAIKWLSWAVILLDKGGDGTATIEVLSCRASCYKEVGEYKKAVADCTKVLEHEEKNVSVLVQRALLYESMEKYRLGAEDLRTVLKIDPANRIARSTIHRLTKMAD